ncbi:hypothetical protein GCM10009744_06850 [Kribbella alba]|uniref:Membrane protein ArfC n=1 Tax=Kribbella alba TaxID=190197 RepID=A0ABN2EYF7_9ACTN
MGWLLRHNWPWTLVVFLLGAVITWVLLGRRQQSKAPVEARREAEEPVEEKTLVGAGVGATASEPAARTTPAPASRRFEPDPPEVQIEPPAPVTAAPPAPEPDQPAAPEPAVQAPPEPKVPVFSRRMEAADDQAVPTLFDAPVEAEIVVPAKEVPAGRYGEGSADAVQHQGPPDGFTIKGNAQSMLFHTPDSPYYGRTKPEVWFRSEADAERAGFTKYARRPRKSPGAGR